MPVRPVSRFLNVAVVLCLALSKLANPLHGADAGGSDVVSPADLTAIAAKCTSYFQAVKSVEFHAERFGITLHWIEKGDQYRFEWVQTKPYMAQTEAFDGKSYQRLDPKRAVLSLSKKPFSVHEGLNNETFFTTPFEWAIPRTVENSGDAIKIEALQSPGLFSKVLASASHPLKTTKNGQPVIQLTLPGGVDFFFKQPYLYQVYFSLKQDDYPIGWERIDLKGKVISQYHVVEVGQIAIDGHVSIDYPKQINAGYYFPEDAFDASKWGAPSMIMKSLSINSVSDEAFTIDPSTAKGIYDFDAHKFISIPK